MLRTLPQTRDSGLPIRLAGVAIFVVLTVIAAKINFNIGPVPITMQVFAVLLSGMVLGARDGAFSQITYVSLIVMNLPVDARGLGMTALAGPTGGYLIGFVVAAAATGLLVERTGDQLWQRWLAGVAGIAVIYLFGVSHLKLYTGMDLGAAWAAGAAPFIVLDAIKTLIAAGMVESIRRWLMREKSKHTPEFE